MAHLTRVKTRLALHPHHLVRGLLEGAYAAVQTGRGHEFNDLRDYVRGDDVKDIDWKASARGRQLLVKRYVAERQHNVTLCVSTGRSMAASNDAMVSKRELAIFVAGMMGYLAVRHGDRVGMVYGDAERQLLRPSDATELHLEHLLAAIHDSTTPESPSSDLAAVLRYAIRTVKRRTIMVIVADEVAVTEEMAELLRRLLAQHELLFFTIGDVDPTDAALSGRLYDIDRGVEVPEWLRHDRRLRQQYASLVANEESGMRRRLDQLGVVHERVRDTESAISAVFRLLERHRHARRR